MTEEELTEIRAYKPAEVAQMLDLPITRLKTWVREDLVPHVRAGALRGVEFSAEDIRQIARMRPELMGGRRGGPATTSPQSRTESVEQPTSAAAQPPVIDIAAWSQLRAHRPRPRST
jgi:hypothetical protein